MTPLEMVLGATTALTGGGGVWAFLTARGKRPSEIVDAQANFQRALTEQSTAFSVAIMQLVGHQQKELDSLRAEVTRLAGAEQDCRQENDQLHQKVDSLVRRLRQAGVVVFPEDKKVPKPFAEMHDGEVTMYQEGIPDD